MANYTGTSLVDYLKSVGQASDYTSRTALAQQKGITNYTGTAEQNVQLLDILRTPTPTSAITSDTLAGQQGLITLPMQSTDTTNYAATLAGAKAVSAPTTEDPAVKAMKDYMATLQTAYPKPPSGAEAYTSTYGAIDTPEQIAAKEASVKTSTDKINALNAQIQGIVNSATQANLQLESQAAGKDITSAFLGKQQQEINRQSAIQVLPLETQVLTEQATLAGNTALLEQAQGKVDTYFKFQQQDAENTYKYYNDLRDKVFDYMTKEQQRISNEQKDKIDKAFQLATSNRSDQFSRASTAISSGQGSLVSQIMALDANSPTFQQDLAALSGQIRPKVTPTAKVYTEKTVPGEIRQSIMDTINDAETTNTELNIESMMTMFPEVDKETLQSYLDEFYAPVTPKGKGIINKVGEWIGSAWNFVWNK